MVNTEVEEYVWQLGAPIECQLPDKKRPIANVDTIRYYGAIDQLLIVRISCSSQQQVNALLTATLLIPFSSLTPQTLCIAG